MRKLLFMALALVATNSLVAGPGEITAGYFKVQTALAGDDFEAAKSAAAALETVSKPEAEIAAAAGAVAKAADIKSARKVFEPLSEKMIGFAKTHASAEKPVFVANCPMVPEDGASWLQENRQIANPYYGASMLRCGVVTETLGAKAE